MWTAFLSLKVSLGLWPILMTIKNCSYPKPPPLGVFCDIGKPNLDIFIAKLASELNMFFEYNAVHDKFVQVAQTVFIADAPARAYLQCIKGHNSYSGCSFCRIEGQLIDRRMCFLFSSAHNISQLSRSDELCKCNAENN